MFLKDKKSGDSIEVLSLDKLIDPFQDNIIGRFHSGEEMQENTEFNKSDLLFPSGESLPKCWVDENYRTK